MSCPQTKKKERKKKTVFAKPEAGVEERQYSQVRLRAADSQSNSRETVSFHQSCRIT